ELLDAAATKGGMEVISEFASPIPVSVICDMLGAPRADRETLGAWSGAATALLEPLLSPDDFAAAESGLRCLLEYFDELVRERRRHPRDDLLSRLMSAEEGGDRLTHDEL